MNHRSEAVRNALIKAMSDLLAERGAEVTLDDVATRAEVGRRTIFRYFATKDDLVAEAIAASLRTLVDAIPHREGRQVDEWLYDVARTVHAQNIRIAPAFLEGARRRRDIPGVAAFMDRPGRRRRYQRMETLAQEAWDASGGAGTVSSAIAESFTLHLSVFASEALQLHCRLDADHMAQLTVETLLALIHQHMAKPPAIRR